MTIERGGSDGPVEIEVEHGRPDEETVLGVRRLPGSVEWEYMLDPKRKIGYVRIDVIGRRTPEHYRRAMKGLLEQGMKGLVLDLRFSIGAYLTSGNFVSNSFLDEGLITKIKSRFELGWPDKYFAKREGTLPPFPMVCLVNGRTMRGSEVVAAALQDHRRAYIVGERSFGHGGIQHVQPFKGGAIRVTTTSFWRANGKSLYREYLAEKPNADWGVTPDRVVPTSKGEREQLRASFRRSEVILVKGQRARKSDFVDRQLGSALQYLRERLEEKE